MKPIFYIILTGLIILVAFQVYALISPVTDTPQAQLLPNSPKTDLPHAQSKSNRFDSVQLNNVIKKVTQRNLFKVEVSGESNKTPAPEKLDLEKTSLKLILLGTATGQSSQDGWAVIKDQVNKQQDLYRVNDEIQGATIKSILRKKVILTVNGRDQILEVNADPSPRFDRKPRPFRNISRPPRNRSQNRKKVEDVLNAIPKSNPLFKTRPYVRDGDAAGVMIYSIKKDSVARLLGLRNGDIIQAIDDVTIEAPQDLEDFGDNIDEHSDMTISILRRGKSKELFFSGQDNAYSINDVEQ